MFEKTKTRAKEHIKDVATLKGSSHSIAFGFSLGTLIAILPTFGFGIFIGLLLVLLFRKISKLALFASFIIWNPFVLLSIYPVNYIVGNAVLSNLQARVSGGGILNSLFEYSGKFLIGSVILAVITAAVSYLIIFLLIEGYKKGRLKSKQNKFINKIN
jgi:uncharacterized protein (DUF2062 family)